MERSTLSEIAVDRRKGFDAQNRLGLGIDRIKGPLETAVEDVGKDVMPDLAGRIGGADDGDGFRGKNCIKTVHGFSFFVQVFHQNFTLNPTDAL